MTSGGAPGTRVSAVGRPWIPMGLSDPSPSITGDQGGWEVPSVSGSTMNQIFCSYVDLVPPDATGTSSPTVKSPITSAGSSAPEASRGKQRSWSTEGIPSDAVKVTAEFIWLHDARMGKTYKRRHGKKSTYSAGCHCHPCFKANKEAALRYLESTKANGGRAKRYDGDELREYVLWLSAEKNIGRRAISLMTGIHEASIQRIMRGKDGQPPPKTVMPRIAELIYAITGEEEDRPSQCRIPSDLTIKRVQSLLANGFSGGHIHKLMTNKEANGGSNRINKLISEPENHPYIFVHMAESVRRVYQMVGDTRAEEMGARKSAATQSRNYAARHGWGTPASWDDPGTLFGEWEEDEDVDPVDVDDVVVERIIKGGWSEACKPNKLEQVEVIRRVLDRGGLQDHAITALHISEKTYRRICAENGIVSTPSIIRR